LAGSRCSWMHKNTSRWTKDNRQGQKRTQGDKQKGSRVKKWTENQEKEKHFGEGNKRICESGKWRWNAIWSDRQLTKKE
jgi:hypothetical protein